MTDSTLLTKLRVPEFTPTGAAKVPAIGVLFWVIKLLTTGIGEAASDFLGSTNLALAGLVGIGGFVYALKRQLAAPAYDAVTYWTAVLAVAVFGTMAADGVHEGLSNYGLTTGFYVIVVAAIFALWHRAEGTLSIHSITTPARERWYWGAVLGTFALGTAAGDLTAVSLHLGFFGAALVFAAIILLPLLAWTTGRLNPILGFWAAYVVTRPLGASVADWLGKPQDRTGVGLGDGTVTGLGLIAFVALVAYVARTRRDVQTPEEVEGDHPRHHAHLGHLQPQPQPAEG